ncbi:MAG: aldolase [Chloroflexi bacterium]|nr:aldolase [Chloroflexota bacterium]
MLQEFQQVGADLFAQGLISSHAGNLSVRLGDRMVITRRGSMLAHLQERDLIETGIDRNDSGIALASTETVVHRAIYRHTSALAIVHAHPPTSVALSLLMDEIVPVDSESSYLLHKVPVIATEHTTGSADVARLAPEYLQDYKIVVIRGHGIYAIGQVLEEAFQWASTLEESCKIIYLLRTLGQEVKDYRKRSESYRTW